MPTPEPLNMSSPPNFKAIQRGLRQTVFTPINIAIFESARNHRPALREFAGIESVLGTLADRSKCPASRADSIVSALILEYQRQHHPFWSSSLMLAFIPMLHNLRRQIGDPILPPEDLTGMLILAFHEVLARLDLSEHRHVTLLRIRQETRRRISFALKKERQSRGLCRMVPDDVLVNLSNTDHECPDSPTSAAAKDPVTIKAAVQRLRDGAAPLMADDDIELIACTAIWGESLWKFIDDRFPSISQAARIRTYERLKRRRSRKIVEVRSLFSKMLGTKTDVSAS